VHVFSDQYIDKEANKNWFESLIDYLTDTKANILETDRDIEVAEYTTVPNVAQFIISAAKSLSDGIGRGSI